MTPHDRERMNLALEHNYKAINKLFHSDEDELESVHDAIRGLQSTDDPALNPLHDHLQEQAQLIKARIKAKDDLWEKQRKKLAGNDGIV